jgi:hypothetical protein
MRGAEALLDCSAPSAVFLFQANYLQYPPNKQLNNTQNEDWIASAPAPRKDGDFFVSANHVKQSINTRNEDWIASAPAPRKDGTFFVIEQGDAIF